MFLKVVCLVIFLIIVDEAVASCIQYGHACWGGHGKRANSYAGGKDIEPLRTQVNKEWFLSRLIYPDAVTSLLDEETEGQQRNGDANKDDLYALLQSRPQANQ